MGTSNARDYVFFETAEDIAAYPGYLANNPLTDANFREIVGWYHLPQHQLCCVANEVGSLCRQQHFHGWVARKSDGTITVLGRNCANDKFNADSSVFKHIQLANNARLENERQVRIRVLVERAAAEKALLDQSIAQLKEGLQSIAHFLAEIGPSFRSRIESMGRNSDGSVVVEGITVKEYEENGQVKEERRVTRHSLGMLDGIAAIDRTRCTTQVAELAASREAFQRASELSTLDRKEKQRIERLLEQAEPARVRGAQLRESMQRFLANPAWLYCFLIDDRAERIRLARLAMYQERQTGGRHAAKDWLANKDREIALKLNVDYVRVTL